MLGMKLLSALKDPIAWLIVMVGLLFRAAIGHHPYSGTSCPMGFMPWHPGLMWCMLSTKVPWHMTSEVVPGQGKAMTL